MRRNRATYRATNKFATLDVMKVLREKHFIFGNLKAIAGLAFLLFLASILFMAGRELTTGAVLGLATRLTP